MFGSVHKPVHLSSQTQNRDAGENSTLTNAHSKARTLNEYAATQTKHRSANSQGATVCVGWHELNDQANVRRARPTKNGALCVTHSCVALCRTSWTTQPCGGLFHELLNWLAWRLLFSSRQVVSVVYEQSCVGSDLRMRHARREGMDVWVRSMCGVEWRVVSRIGDWVCRINLRDTSVLMNQNLLMLSKDLNIQL